MNHAILLICVGRQVESLSRHSNAHIETTILPLHIICKPTLLLKLKELQAVE